MDNSNDYKNLLEIAKTFNAGVTSVLHKHHFIKFKNTSYFNSIFFGGLCKNANFTFPTSISPVNDFFNFDLPGILNLNWEEFLQTESLKIAFSKLKKKVELHKELSNQVVSQYKYAFFINAYSKLLYSIDSKDELVKSIFNKYLEIDQEQVLNDIRLFYAVTLLTNKDYSAILRIIENLYETISLFIDNIDLRFNYISAFLLSKVSERSIEKVYFPSESIGYLGVFPPSYSDLRNEHLEWESIYKIQGDSAKELLPASVRSSLSETFKVIKSKFISDVGFKNIYSSFKMLNSENISGLNYLKLLFDLIVNNKEFVFNDSLVTSDFVSSLPKIEPIKKFFTSSSNNVEDAEEFIGALSEISLQLFLNSQEDFRFIDLNDFFNEILKSISSLLANGVDPFLDLGGTTLFELVSLLFPFIDIIEGAFPGGLEELLNLIYKSSNTSFIKIFDRIESFIKTKSSILKSLSKLSQDEYYNFVIKHYRELEKIILKFNILTEADFDLLLLEIANTLDSLPVLMEDDTDYIQKANAQTLKNYFRDLEYVILNKITILENAFATNQNAEEMPDKDSLKIIEAAYYNLLSICSTADSNKLIVFDGEKYKLS